MTFPSVVEALIFDFDGVLVDSERVREGGFRAVLSQETPDLVDRLVAYHRENGGISRYEKFRWFYRELKGQRDSERLVELKSAEFKALMLEHMCDRSLLIRPAAEFVSSMYGRVPMYICSGSDEGELRQICEFLGIAMYFDGIRGSPQPKEVIVDRVIVEGVHMASNVLLIGDSTNDLDAASVNGIPFCGTANHLLRGKGVYYIDSWSDFAARVTASLRQP